VFRRTQGETLPWYRQRGYDGDLTEAEKRELDGLRALPEHPATQREDLPDEVQSYLAHFANDREVRST